MEKKVTFVLFAFLFCSQAVTCGYVAGGFYNANVNPKEETRIFDKREDKPVENENLQPYFKAQESPLARNFFYNFPRQPTSLMTTAPNAQNWMDNVQSTVKELIRQFEGFTPYLSKLVKPLIKALMDISQKFRMYVTEYFNSLPPETLSSIQTKLFSLGNQLINYNLLGSLLPIFMRSAF